MDKDYLSEKEQIAVVNFCKNKEMYQAIKKVLLATIYSQGTVKAESDPNEFNFAFGIATVGQTKTDEQIGQELRAAITALNYLKTGFDRLLEFLPNQEKPEKKGNPAR